MNEIQRALVVDGDFLMRGHLIEVLRGEGIVVFEAESKETASRLLIESRFDLVFADLNIIATLDKGKICSGEPGVRPDWVITASFGTVDRAIEYVRRGAYDYLLKPFSPAQVAVVLARLQERRRLRLQVSELEKQVDLSPETGTRSDLETVCDEIFPTTNLQEIERQTIIRVLHETGGCRGAMADMLGISVRTLRNKLNQYRQEAQLQYP